jgi:hypothetical protein
MRTNFIIAMLWGSQWQFHTDDAPTQNSFLLWISRWHEEGSVRHSRPLPHLVHI